MLHVSFSTATPSNTSTIAAPTNGQRIRIARIDFSVTLAGDVTFSEGTAATGTRLVYLSLGDNGGAFVDFSGIDGYYLPAETALLRTATAGTLTGVVWYTIN